MHQHQQRSLITTREPRRVIVGKGVTAIARGIFQELGASDLIACQPVLLCKKRFHFTGGPNLDDLRRPVDVIGNTVCPVTSGRELRQAGTG